MSIQSIGASRALADDIVSALDADVGSSLCFFFQAEVGIRDKLVTGVQTCALPILGAPVAGFGNPRTVPSDSRRYAGSLRTKPSRRAAAARLPGEDSAARSCPSCASCWSSRP